MSNTNYKLGMHKNKELESIIAFQKDETIDKDYLEIGFLKNFYQDDFWHEDPLKKTNYAKTFLHSLKKDNSQEYVGNLILARFCPEFNLKNKKAYNLANKILSKGSWSHLIIINPKLNKNLDQKVLKTNHELVKPLYKGFLAECEGDFFTTYAGRIKIPAQIISSDPYPFLKIYIQKKIQKKI